MTTKVPNELLEIGVLADTTNFTNSILIKQDTTTGTLSSASNNTGVGDTAFASLTSGNDNAGFGFKALTLNTTGSDSVAVGAYSLQRNTTGSNNVAIGYDSLGNNTTASNNVAVGREALQANTTESKIVAVGTSALTANTTGTNGVAVGADALKANTTGDFNTGIGFAALEANTTGANNTAVGFTALDANTTGSNSTAIGLQALTSQTTGTFNTALGMFAGQNLTTGEYNTFIGSGTIAGTGNFGAGDLMTTGNKNTFLGGYNGNQNSLDLRTSSNNIVLSDGDGNPRLFINSNGGMQVGTVSMSTATSNAIFSAGGTNVRVLDVQNTGTTGRVMAVSYGGNGPDNTSDYYVVYNDNNSNDCFIYSNGNLANKNNSYGSSSDIKIKQNISDANSQWNDIKALQFKNYKLKTDVARYGEDNADTLLGLIAQDVETAGMNGLVYESKDEDSDGNDLGTVTKGVKYSVLYLKAVKALQEAIVKIEDLELRIKTLEG